MRLDAYIKTVALAMALGSSARETSSLEMTRHEFVKDASVRTFHDHENDAIVMKLDRMEVKQHFADEWSFNAHHNDSWSEWALKKLGLKGTSTTYVGLPRDQAKQIFYGTFYVGSQKWPQNLLIDTGSRSVNLFTKACTNCIVQQSSASPSFYDAVTDEAANGLTRDPDYTNVRITYGTV